MKTGKTLETEVHNIGERDIEVDKKVDREDEGIFTNSVIS